MRKVTDTLRERGYKLSKTSVGRWAKAWTPENAPAPQTAQKLLPPPAEVPAKFDGIPDELRDALSPRLLALSSGKGLERVENAVIQLANAVASKSEEIAALLLETESETESSTKEDGATSSKRIEKANAARSAVSAVATLAQAMNIIASSKALTAMSHRNYAEGDLYLAQAERARAEARMFDADADAKIGAGRAANARIVNGEFTEVPPDDAQSALDALHSQVRPAAKQ